MYIIMYLIYIKNRIYDHSCNKNHQFKWQEQKVIVREKGRKARNIKNNTLYVIRITSIL